MANPALGVVMPCFNEKDWVRRSVAALDAAARRADWDVRVLVVDDGSDDPETIRTLDSLAAEGSISLVRQANAGRLAARAAGLDAVGTDNVLLLDSRVLIDENALVVLADRWREEPGSVWNAHVDVATQHNPWAAFWGGATKIGWRRYFARPRRVSFGLAEFDAYPKGTGAFAAPVSILQEAARDFDSLFSDARFASDDTKLLRNVAALRPINIEPGFRVDYFGRDTGPKWARQVLFRGTTFVDGYVGTRRRAATLLAALGVLLPATGWLAIKHPGAVAVAAVGASAGAGAVARACGGTRDETAWTGVLLAPFTAIFGVGFLRGLLMAVSAGPRRGRG